MQDVFLFSFMISKLINSQHDNHADHAASQNVQNQFSRSRRHWGAAAVATAAQKKHLRVWEGLKGGGRALDRPPPSFDRYSFNMAETDVKMTDHIESDWLFPSLMVSVWAYAPESSDEFDISCYEKKDTKRDLDACNLEI